MTQPLKNNINEIEMRLIDRNDQPRINPQGPLRNQNKTPKPILKKNPRCTSDCNKRSSQKRSILPDNKEKREKSGGESEEKEESDL